MKRSKNTKNEDENPSQVRVTSRELIISSKEIISNNTKCRKQILKFIWNTWKYWRNEIDGEILPVLAQFLIFDIYFL